MNVPKLRFKEFDGEWEEQKLKEISFLTDGTHSTPKYTSKGVPFWSVETITTNASVKYISNEEHTELIKRCKPEFGDILITRISSGINSLGVPKLVNWKEEFSIYVSVGLIKPKDIIEPKYLVSYIESPNYKREFLSKSLLTATPKKINMSDLGETKVTLPLLEEQKKIGNFFEILNKKIQLQQQKIDLLQEQKKGYMQKVFKQELRFKNEEGQYYPDWKNRKIRDLFEVTRGHVLSTKEISEMGKYPVYSSQTKNNGLLGYYDEFLFENAITWTTDGANAGNVKYRSGKFYCTNVCGVLLNKEGYANKCIAEIINSIAFRYVSYVGNPKLMNNVMGDISIDFPCIEEQKKISDFLLILDNKINLEETTLKLLRNQKKGFMQKMFI